MSERLGDWMQTYTGKQFWPLDPRPEDVDILDIAHALSMLCRYGGHSNRFYSVAEHCCHIHDYMPDKFKAWGLMHDASEAYIVDVPRPIKPHIPGYKEIERRIMQAVCQAFCMDENEPPEVKIVDGRILVDEQRKVMSRPPVPWMDFGEPLGVEIQFWNPARAKAEFIGRARLNSLI